MRNRPPVIQLRVSDLPKNPTARREALADIFGQYLFWARHAVLSRTKSLVTNPEARRTIAGKIFREPYDRAATLPSEQREIAFELVTEGIDCFANELLGLLSNEGVDLRLGEDHAIRFRLVIEICEANTEDEAVILEEPINRGGKRYFAGNWGRWLNRFGGFSEAPSAAGGPSGT